MRVSIPTDETRHELLTDLRTDGFLRTDGKKVDRKTVDYILNDIEPEELAYLKAFSDNRLTLVGNDRNISHHGPSEDGGYTLILNSSPARKSVFVDNAPTYEVAFEQVIEKLNKAIAEDTISK